MGNLFKTVVRVKNQNDQPSPEKRGGFFYYLITGRIIAICTDTDENLTNSQDAMDSSSD